jgi:hypothetical protein
LPASSAINAISTFHDRHSEQRGVMFRSRSGVITPACRSNASTSPHMRQEMTARSKPDGGGSMPCRGFPLPSLSRLGAGGYSVSVALPARRHAARGATNITRLVGSGTGDTLGAGAKRQRLFQPCPAKPRPASGVSHRDPLSAWRRYGLHRPTVPTAEVDSCRALHVRRERCAMASRPSPLLPCLWSKPGNSRSDRRTAAAWARMGLVSSVAQTPYAPLDEDHRRRSSERPPDFEFEWTPEYIRASAAIQRDRGRTQTPQRVRRPQTISNDDLYSPILIRPVGPLDMPPQNFSCR